MSTTGVSYTARQNNSNNNDGPTGIFAVLIIGAVTFIIGILIFGSISKPSPQSSESFTSTIVNGIKDENVYNLSGVSIPHAREIKEGMSETDSAFVIVPTVYSYSTTYNYLQKIFDESDYRVIIFAVKNDGSDTYEFVIITNEKRTLDRTRMILDVGDIKNPADFFYENLDDIQTALGTASSQSGSTEGSTDSAKRK